MPLPQNDPRDLARRLIEREAVRSTGPNPDSAAAHAACEHLYRVLTRSLGGDGCRRLFERVLADAKRDDPALAGIEVGQAGRALEGVAASAAANGDAAVAAALEKLITELCGLLGRFIGADLVVTLAERGGPDGVSGPTEE